MSLFVTDAVHLKQLTFSYGRGETVVESVDLRIEAGSLFCLIGPSGSGKSTLLRLMAGYLKPDSGSVLLGNTDVTDQPLDQRDFGMVFQNYALFPHLTARANVAFGLEARGIPRQERLKRVEEILDSIGLLPEERERRPAELSGGQQQRVALARALVIRPRVLLLDEPFANLDRQLRESLREQLLEIQRGFGVTTLLVTHDQAEALSLADNVGIMSAGRLLQVDKPAVVYNCPRTPFIARFLGMANLFRVDHTADNRLHLEGGLILTGKRSKGNWVMIRPENFVIGRAAEQCPTRWTGRVTAAMFLGPHQILDVAVTPAQMIRVCYRPGEITGDQLTVGIPDDAVWIIPEDDH